MGRFASAAKSAWSPTSSAQPHARPCRVGRQKACHVASGRAHMTLASGTGWWGFQRCHERATPSSTAFLPCRAKHMLCCPPASFSAERMADPESGLMQLACQCSQCRGSLSMVKSWQLMCLSMMVSARKTRSFAAAWRRLSTAQHCIAPFFWRPLHICLMQNASSPLFPLLPPPVLTPVAFLIYVARLRCRHALNRLNRISYELLCCRAWMRGCMFHSHLAALTCVRSEESSSIYHRLP